MTDEDSLYTEAGSGRHGGKDHGGPQKKTNDVTVVDIRQNKDYNQIVDLIFSSDKVISW
jgi:hypothetical protein